MALWSLFFVVLELLGSSQALVSSRMGRPVMMSSTLSDVTRQKIDGLVKENKVMLFMKGNKVFPQCGFSNMAVQILTAMETPFETYDVLSDEYVRQGIKEYADWPTIPQLFVAGEFVGGSDIMLEMYQGGELQEMIELANAN